MHHQQNIQEEWKEEDLPVFSELILSWNAARPKKGAYLFYVSLKIEDEWSSWLPYALWGRGGQKSYQAQEGPVKIYQDAVEIVGKKASGFRIKIVTEEDASLREIYGLHVYTERDVSGQRWTRDSVFLELEGISQRTLKHPRHMDLCSPTSTAAVTRYLSKNAEVDPIAFAQNAWDGEFDIFGHWGFSVAEAVASLGPSWNGWVERLSGFQSIYTKLKEGLPVIVSVRGPLQGSALPYAKGHLIAVIGYDAALQRVHCMDPAFPSDQETKVSYSLLDFLKAWERRGNIAYVFERNGKRGI